MKKYFIHLLQENSIPFMEVIESLDSNPDILIKVYFPKIITSTCKLLNKKFVIKNRDNLIIKRDKDGYHKTHFELIIQDKILHVEIHSMLKYTWGIN